MATTESQNSNKDALLAPKIILPVAALGLLVLRIARPELTIDSVTLGLLLVACLPWFLSILESAKLPGGIEFTVARLQKTVGEQQELINQMVTYSMSENIYIHLWFIAHTEEYKYSNNDAMRRELYYLRDAGYLMPRGGRGFLDFNQDVNGRNLVEFAEPTPIGWSILRLRGEPGFVTEFKAKGGEVHYRPGLSGQSGK